MYKKSRAQCKRVRYASRERSKNGYLNRIFEGVCFRCMVHEDRGLRWKLLVPPLVYHTMIQSFDSHTSVDYRPRREKIGYCVKNHIISVAQVSREVRRSRVAQTPKSVDAFPRLSGIQSTGPHSL